MSYLKFDKKDLINLDQSLSKEILRANKSGTYSYSTIIDCNTRKCHGLLVCPIPKLDNNNHVLVSSIDTTVIQRGSEFNLGLHKYPGNEYSPKGHKYIRAFECEQNPKTLYRIGGVILSRELIFVSFEDRVLIKYTLVDAHSPTFLKFKPFLAFRNSLSLCRENNNINKSYDEIKNGFSCCLYPGYPKLYIQTSSKSEFSYHPDWYKNIEYFKDQEQGYDYQEDLFVPGHITTSIKKGQSIIISIGTKPLSPGSMKKTFEKELQVRTPRNSFTNCLINSAYQFYNKCKNGQRYIIAGYPWFSYKARDMFISLPGCTLYAKNPGLFDLIMETGEKAIRNYMENRPLGCAIKGIEKPDVLLWAIWSLQEYARNRGIEKCANRYATFIFDMIDYIRKNKHQNLFLHENGLLYSNGKSSAISWMDSELYGKPIIPRNGYIVEFNALWYNNLKFAADIATFQKKEDLANKYKNLAAITSPSFLQTFLNDFGYLFDYVDDERQTWSVRPNQLFAVSLQYSPLDKMQKKIVLDYITKELLTPKGIRSLSPKSGGYNPIYGWTHEERQKAYHQGTAWPWLIGHYLDAYLKIYNYSGINFAQRIMYGFEESLNERGIGTISELYDGDPPYRGRGGISFAMSVAELLRAHFIINKKILEEEGEEL